jgi:hypothetical protein
LALISMVKSPYLCIFSLMSLVSMDNIWFYTKKSMAFLMTSESVSMYRYSFSRIFRYKTGTPNLSDILA